MNPDQGKTIFGTTDMVVEIASIWELKLLSHCSLGVLGSFEGDQRRIYLFPPLGLEISSMDKEYGTECPNLVLIRSISLSLRR